MAETSPVVSSSPPSILSKWKRRRTRISESNDDSDTSSSPESRCVICLGNLKSKSFTDSCLHQFCFDCLVKWSKVKAECPLCKQPFKSIIHNVRSNEDYDQYYVQCPLVGSIRVREFVLDMGRSNIATFEEVFRMINYNPRLPSPLSTRTTCNDFRRRGYTSLEFRTYIYGRRLWARPVPDISGRYRESNPTFYRDNPAQMHRLAPWIQREMYALFPHSVARSNADNITLSLLLYEIGTREFREAIAPHLNEHCEQFIHELNTFARSTFDMNGFDEHVEYEYRPWRPATVQTENDSDVEVVQVVQSSDPDLADTIVISDSDSEVEVITIAPQKVEEIVLSSGDEEPRAGTSRASIVSNLPSSEASSSRINGFPRLSPVPLPLRKRLSHRWSSESDHATSLSSRKRRRDGSISSNVSTATSDVNYERQMIDSWDSDSSVSSMTLRRLRRVAKRHKQSSRSRNHDRNVQKKRKHSSREAKNRDNRAEEGESSRTYWNPRSRHSQRNHSSSKSSSRRRKKRRNSTPVVLRVDSSSSEDECLAEFARRTKQRSRKRHTAHEPHSDRHRKTDHDCAQ